MNGCERCEDGIVHIPSIGVEMSSIIKANDFTQSVIDRIIADEKFKCGRSYADMLIWTRLCRPFTHSEIFALLPIVLKNVWANEGTVETLKARGAKKPDTFNLQSLAANIVSFRRADIQDEEIVELKNGFANLAQNFNTLSYSVFEIMKRLSALEEENVALRAELQAKGIISNKSTEGAICTPEKIIFGETSNTAH